jgi:hypothetical protein
MALASISSAHARIVGKPLKSAATCTVSHHAPLSLRTQPGDGTIIAWLATGSQVDIYEEKAKWAFIGDVENGFMGWAYRPFILCQGDVE